MKSIIIQREKFETDEGTKFYCSKIFEVPNFDLSKPIFKELKRNNKQVYCLEKVEVAIPEGEYEIKKDFTGKFQWAKIDNVPNRLNIEIHAGNRLKDTKGCLLLGVGFNEKKVYGDNDIIISDSKNTCDWFINDFLLNDEEKKQTKIAKQDEIIGYVTIE